MSPELQALVIDIKKGLTIYALPTLSYIGMSFLLGYFLVNYLSLPKVFYGTSFSIPFFIATMDSMSEGQVLVIKKARVWWAHLPAYIHIWIVIDCVMYFFLFKAYIKKPLWQNHFGR